MNKVIWLNRGWFPFYYGFCPSERAWHSAMRQMKLNHEFPFTKSRKNISARVTTFDNEHGDMCCVMTLNPTYKPSSARALQGLFVHEAAHVWQKVRECIGEDEPSAEFEAYSLQNIFQQLMWAYDKTRRKTK